MFRVIGDAMSVTEFTPKKREKFLKSLQKIPNVSEACRVAQVSRVTVYNHRNSDEAFKAEWDEALGEGAEALEAVAMQRASSGASDTLMIFLLKGLYPQKYRDNVHHNHTGEVTFDLRMPDDHTDSTES